MPIAYAPPVRYNPAPLSTAASLARWIDQLEQAGAVIDFPEATTARKIAEREASANAFERQVAEAAANTTDLARDIAAGKVSVKDALVRAGGWSPEHGDRMRSAMDKARRILAAESRDALAALGERWITDVIRPAAQPHIDHVIATVEAIPDAKILKPDGPEIYTARHWQDMSLAMTPLVALLKLLDGGQALGIIPRLGALPEDARWRDNARLDGQVERYEYFVALNVKRGAQFGIWLDHEHVEPALIGA